MRRCEDVQKDVLLLKWFINIYLADEKKKIATKYTIEHKGV